MEKDELREQLGAKIKAVEHLQRKIEDGKRSQSEYREIIKQWHVKGFFLKVDSPTHLLALENEVLRHQIEDFDKDLISLRSKSKVECIENNSRDIVSDELFEALKNVIEEKNRIELENESIKAEIEALKNQVSQFQTQNAIDDNVIQENLRLRAKLEKSSCDTKISLENAAKSKRAVSPQKRQTLHQIEIFMRFLNKHPHMTTHGNLDSYFRKVIIEVLEALESKEKWLANAGKQNENLAKRLSDFVPNSVPMDFESTPMDFARSNKDLKVASPPPQDPIV